MARLNIDTRSSYPPFLRTTTVGKKFGGANFTPRDTVSPAWEGLQLSNAERGIVVEKDYQGPLEVISANVRLNVAETRTDDGLVDYEAIVPLNAETMALLTPPMDRERIMRFQMVRGTTKLTIINDALLLAIHRDDDFSKHSTWLALTEGLVSSKEGGADVYLAGMVPLAGINIINVQKKVISLHLADAERPGGNGAIGLSPEGDIEIFDLMSMRPWRHRFNANGIALEPVAQRERIKLPDVVAWLDDAIAAVKGPATHEGTELHYEEGDVSTWLPPALSGDADA